MKSSSRWRLGLLVLLCGTTVWLALTTGSGGGSQPSVSDGLLHVHFLDVGQGDAILITTPDGLQVLVDGGPDSTVLPTLADVLPWYDRSLDLVIGTHTDKDHIGGLVDVLARYDVQRLLITENRGETLVATAYHEAIVAEAATVDHARAGQLYRLGASTTLRVVSPANDPSLWESNTASIVLQLSYGEIDFLLTGDVPIGIEEYVASTHGSALASEVLKLGHHGSRTSTSEQFLQTVRPVYAVVSAGKDNSYGHPHSEVVERVLRSGVQLLQTAEVGTIHFMSDGQTVWLD